MVALENRWVRRKCLVSGGLRRTLSSWAIARLVRLPSGLVSWFEFVKILRELQKWRARWGRMDVA